MSHHVSSADIAINGDHLDKSKIAKVKTISLAVAGLGTLISLYLLFSCSRENSRELRLFLGICLLFFSYSFDWWGILDAAS